jgi:MFS family permease
MAGIDLVLFDILLTTCPQRHSASYIALYQTTNYVATFAAPILGTVMAEAFGYAPALFISSGLRFAGAILFVLLGVGGVMFASAPKTAEPLAMAERGAKKAGD